MSKSFSIHFINFFNFDFFLFFLNISITSTSARRDTWTNLDAPTLADCYAAGDGTYRMIFKVPLETLEPGSYSVDVQLTFYNGKGPRWKNEVYAKIDLG